MKRNHTIYIIHTILLTLIYLALPAYAKTYSNTQKNYSISFNNQWRETNFNIDSDILLACTGNNCAQNKGISEKQDRPTTITIGATFKPTFQRSSISEFMNAARGNADIFMKRLRNAPIINDFKITNQKETKINNTPAYEIITQFRYINNINQRKLYTYMTFNKGYIYNISIHCSPSSCDNDLKLARKVITTFHFNSNTPTNVINP